MPAVLANESELYFERGGPAYRFMQWIGLIAGDDPSVRRRIVAFLAITWVPLALFSILEGHALGPTPRQSLLLDFATYARFFLCVPLLIVAEVVIGPRLRSAGLQFVHAGFVRPEQFSEFDAAIARVARWRESGLVEAVLVCMAIATGWTLSPEAVYGGGSASWQVTLGDEGAQFTWAGLWYKSIAAPIMQFLFLRWLWRLIIWTGFLVVVSRLNLDLAPTHADQAGGLGFLGTNHVCLGVLAVAVSSVISADAAFRIVFEGASIETFRVPAIVFLVATEVICLGPLVVFTPLMARKRREALREYSILVLRYNRAFHNKWVAAGPPADEPLLGSADFQSLADLGGSFEFIRSMRSVPFSIRVVMQLAVVAAIPAAPLLPLVMPWSEIFKLVTGVVL